MARPEQPHQPTDPQSGAAVGQGTQIDDDRSILEELGQVRDLDEQLPFDLSEVEGVRSQNRQRRHHPLELERHGARG